MTRRSLGRRRRARRQSTAVTIRDVAAAARVSTATVSRVVGGLDGVREEVRARVLSAVRRLDYHPNALARDLRAGLRKVVGVVIPDLHNPFFPGVVHGVEEVLYQAGYTLVLGHSDGKAERERNHIAVLRGEGAAGLILIPDNGSDASYGCLRSWKVPVVAVDRSPRGLDVDLVTTSNREGARSAVEHLLSHGYKDIAFINGPEELSVARERLAGYHEALRAAGIAFRDAYVVHSDFRQEGGRIAMDRLLALPKPPRAVLSGNNLMTLGALQAIHARGLEVPGEVAVIGFDDMPWATSLRPPLTAVTQPDEELGRTAAQLLLDRLRDPERPARHRILPTRLVVRASCGSHEPLKDEPIPPVERKRQPVARRQGNANNRKKSLGNCFGSSRM